MTVPTQSYPGEMLPEPLPAPPRGRWRRWLAIGSSNLMMILFFIVLVLAVALPFSLKTVGSGEVGVLWKRFGGGTVLSYTLGEGVHFIFPWDKLFIYNLRLQEYSHNYDTISSDGLNMVVEIAVRYRIDPKRVALLHKYVGPDYTKILIDPAVGSQARELISLYTPEELYKSARGFIQNQITERLNRDNLVEIEELGGSVILLLVEDVLVRGISMPDLVRQAIERKAEQNQIMLEYDFRLQRELREKERRQIEAEGLRAYQDAMPTGIPQTYLILRGIEATQELAKSNNSKVLIFGNAGANLPFILNSLLSPDQLQAAGLTPPAQSTPAPAQSSAQPQAGAVEDKAREQEAFKDLIEKMRREGVFAGVDPRAADAPKAPAADAAKPKASAAPRRDPGPATVDAPSSAYQPPAGQPPAAAAQAPSTAPPSAPLQPNVPR